MDLRAGMDTVEKRKTFYPNRDSKSDSWVVQLIACTYRLNSPGSEDENKENLIRN